MYDHLSLSCFLQFLTFAERLAKVNIDVIHRIDRTGSFSEVCSDSDHKGSTLFFSDWISFPAVTGSGNVLFRRADEMERPQPHRTFQYVWIIPGFSWLWMEVWIRLLSRFTATFLREVSSKSQSFNLLVFHQKSIVESLQTHLAVKDSLAFQPLLEWVWISCFSGGFLLQLFAIWLSFPAWWCSWPETCRRTSTRISQSSSLSSPLSWKPKTQSCWNGLSPACPTSTSTCGGSWWRTWPTSTGEGCRSSNQDIQIKRGWSNWTNFLFLSIQFVQHPVGAQEGAHPQLCSWELLLFDEKGLTLLFT